MREILFKAKRVDNREWIIGSLVVPSHLLRGVWIIEKITIAGLVLDKEENITKEDIEKAGMQIGEFWEVIPETVCEFSGITDKNGVKIFEGDIIKMPEHFPSPVFFFMGEFNIDKYSNGLNNRIDDYNGDVEVIGNIHDKKEDK